MLREPYKKYERVFGSFLNRKGKSITRNEKNEKGKESHKANDITIHTFKKATTKVKILNVRPETIKLLEENTGSNSLTLVLEFFLFF